MRKSIVVLIVAVLAVAAGAVVLSLSAPVLDEEVEYRLTSLYYRGQEISSQVDGDEVLDLLEGASRGLISRGGLPAHSFRDMVEVQRRRRRGGPARGTLHGGRALRRLSGSGLELCHSGG